MGVELAYGFWCWSYGNHTKLSLSDPALLEYTDTVGLVLNVSTAHATGGNVEVVPKWETPTFSGVYLEDVNMGPNYDQRYDFEHTGSIVSINSGSCSFESVTCVTSKNIFQHFSDYYNNQYSVSYCSTNVPEFTKYSLTNCPVDAYFVGWNEIIYNDPTHQLYNWFVANLIASILPDRAEWTEEDFNCRKKITVKKEAVSGSPRNIPVKVDFPGNDAALYHALTNYKSGALMKVTTESGLEIAAEAGIRLWENGGKDIRLFFLAPILSSEEDTVFYLYYASNVTAEMTFIDADVWTHNHTGVWHDGYEVVGQYAKVLGRY